MQTLYVLFDIGGYGVSGVPGCARGKGGSRIAKIFYGVKKQCKVLGKIKRLLLRRTLG